MHAVHDRRRDRVPTILTMFREPQDDFVAVSDGRDLLDRLDALEDLQPMPDRLDPHVLQVLLVEYSEVRAVDVVVGERSRVLRQLQLLRDPLADLLDGLLRHLRERGGGSGTRVCRARVVQRGE